MNNVLRIIRSWEAKGNSIYNLYDRLIPYLREEDKPKGTCETCGGSGRVLMTKHVHMMKDCPDCGGTGEEKKKYCLRCGVVCSEDSVVPCYRAAGEQIGIHIAEHRWTDERSG